MIERENKTFARVRNTNAFIPALARLKIKDWTAYAGRRITRSRDEPATAMKAALACSSG
jgi:hypothetical protein